MDLGKLLTQMVAQFRQESQKASNNSVYFTGAAEGLEAFAAKAAELEQQQEKQENESKESNKSAGSKKKRASKPTPAAVEPAKS